jgi:hypothetical protein
MSKPRQRTVEVRMDYVLRMMKAVAEEREWYELSAALYCASQALEREIRASKKKKRRPR